ncbi:MAG: VWA domain-containing protein, partial [Caldilineaceae bacterium]|nr:VWA domain-containing protein [Caldilineaceae bacterium]
MMPEHTPHTSMLLENLIRFGRVLRAAGMPVAPAQMIDALEGLRFVEIRRKRDFFFALRALLVKRHADLLLFDRAFAAFWRSPQDGLFQFDPASPPRTPAARTRRPHAHPASSRAPRPSRGRKSTVQDESAGQAAVPDAHVDNPPQDEQLAQIRTHSRREALRQADFATLTSAELAAIKEVIRTLAWHPAPPKTRRRTARQPGSSRRGRRTPDLRRMIRDSRRHGGEITLFRYRYPKTRPRRVVVLTDISGSMRPTARLMLHYLYAMSHGLGCPVEVFLFGTRLTRITRAMAKRDVEEALDAAAALTPDWAGGTQIGRSLRHFNHEWRSRVLRREAVVLIISDGWDRGDVALLGREMERLHLSARRLIWINPLLRWDGFVPKARGIAAMLPHVD